MTDRIRGYAVCMCCGGNITMDLDGSWHHKEHEPDCALAEPKVTVPFLGANDEV